jgi:hypothetical protein
MCSYCILCIKSHSYRQNTSPYIGSSLSLPSYSMERGVSRYNLAATLRVLYGLLLTKRRPVVFVVLTSTVLSRLLRRVVVRAFGGASGAWSGFTFVACPLAHLRGRVRSTDSETRRACPRLHSDLTPVRNPVCSSSPASSQMHCQWLTLVCLRLAGFKQAAERWACRKAEE